MIRIEIEATVPDCEEGGLMTAAMRAAQSIDLGDDVVIHRITVEEQDA